MKTFSFYALAALLLWAIWSALVPSSGDVYTLTAADKEAIEAIEAEPKVYDTDFTSGVLYVSVDDDGTNRKGYAMYVCEVLNEHRSKGFKEVKVVEYNTAHKKGSLGAHGILLGEYKCGS